MGMQSPAALQAKLIRANIEIELLAQEIEHLQLTFGARASYRAVLAMMRRRARLLLAHISDCSLASRRAVSH